MPVTIGQLILSVRSKIPDLPPCIPPAYNVLPVDTLGPGSLSHGIYFLVVTQFNAYGGESLPSAEASVNLTIGNAIDIGVTTFPNVVKARVYITLPGGGAGNEIAYVDFPVTTVGVQTFHIGDFPTNYAPIPAISSAYIPDANGPMFSAYTLYDWMNDALNKISHVVEGVQDYCGVPTLSGQPLYTIPGQWLSISDVWYGGYWVQGGSRSYFYRRNAVATDVLSNVTISIQSDKQVMEVSYQPDRNSGVTSTAASMSTAADTTVQINDSSVFLLPFGFAQFGPDANGNVEIVAYSSLLGNVMSGMIRGIGNTVAQAWGSQTPVTELSLFWCGRRVFNTLYSPGQSALALPVPAGWSTILQLYMLGQAKKAEQDMQAGSALEKQAFEEAMKWMYSNRGVLSRVQVGGSLGGGTVVYDETPAGGVIIP